MFIDKIPRSEACTAAVAPVIYEYYAQYIEYVY